MVRSVAERYAVAAFAFMAAATWLGVGVVHGLLCLLVALVASQAVRIYQRRSGTRAAATSRQRRRTRPAQRTERPRRAGLYDAGTDDFDWPTAGDAAW